MIESIYIRNFKAIGRGVYKLFGHDALLVGESAAGKTSLLEALDCFFNRTHADSRFFADSSKPICIGVQVDGCKFMREFDCTTLEGTQLEAEGDWSSLGEVAFVYVPSPGATFCNVAAQLARADALETIAGLVDVGAVSGALEESAARIASSFSGRVPQVPPQASVNMSAALRTVKCESGHPSDDRLGSDQADIDQADIDQADTTKRQ